MSTTKESNALETELTDFLLLVAGIFFLYESLVHYADFFLDVHGGNTPVATAEVIGNAVIGIFYLSFAYACWRAPKNKELFGLAAILSGLLSVSFFAVQIVETWSPHLYNSLYINYLQFIIGFGSATIFVELLVVFFSWRIYRSIA